MTTESTATPAQQIANGYGVEGQALKRAPSSSTASPTRPRISASRWPLSTGTAWSPAPPAPARPNRCR